MAAEHVSFQPVRTVRAYQRVAEQIEDRILTGELPPGSRLPAERELVRQFAVGRSTVREALRVLQSAGLIRSRPGDPLGAEVLGVSPDNLSEALDRLTRSHLSSLGELVQFRMLLDAESYRLAARAHTPDDLARMTALVDRMAELAARSAPDTHAFSEADAAFHRTVAEAGGNALLALCARAVHDAVARTIESGLARTGSAADRMERSVAHHRQVLAALRDGAGPLAAHLGRRALYDHYAAHVDPVDRPRLEAALDDSPQPGHV